MGVTTTLKTESCGGVWMVTAVEKLRLETTPLALAVAVKSAVPALAKLYT